MQIDIELSNTTPGCMLLQQTKLSDTLAAFANKMTVANNQSLVSACILLQ